LKTSKRGYPSNGAATKSKRNIPHTIAKKEGLRGKRNLGLLKKRIHKTKKKAGGDTIRPETGDQGRGKRNRKIRMKLKPARVMTIKSHFWGKELRGFGKCMSKGTVFSTGKEWDEKGDKRLRKGGGGDQTLAGW